MFQKILIANRGEIACRIIKTAKKMGVLTVAVYSDADKNALHVQLADEAIHIGSSPSRESYLVVEKVIEAAKVTGAEAIHPGYGFLSENAEFCRACSENNITFVGPPVSAIEAMGSKSAAKNIMQAANVPLVPGYHGEDQSLALLKQSADEMGYPVLLKATAGGGGKGMRQVWDSQSFTGELSAAKREAMSSFGDETMLVEKYLIEPRHVEIQVFCDNHDNAVYLFERDCSVQRRHQKVIEEAPAFKMSDKLRSEMGESAIQSAKAIGYQGAGTVEFLLDANGEFYFMEMNTRLQVEHPVTEMISGQDLVEWQLRVAFGEVLPKTQEQLQLNGHAFEARIYAEDTQNDFLPATGTLNLLETPQTNNHVRIDTGVRQGDEVSVYYDPMIAKLIVWDEDRPKALKRLAKALSEYQIDGVTTNIDFLYDVATSSPFVKEEIDTSFIEKNHDELFSKSEDNSLTEQLQKDLITAALYSVLSNNARAKEKALNSTEPYSPWHTPSAWRMNEAQSHQVTFSHGENYKVTLEPNTLDGISGNTEEEISYNASITTEHALEDKSASHVFHCQAKLTTDKLTTDSLIVTLDGHRIQVTISNINDVIKVYKHGGMTSFKRLRADLGNAENQQSAGGLCAPMNGTMVSVLVKPQDKVEKDQPLVIMEAMKMEHTIKAPFSGMVNKIYFAKGDMVDGGAELLELISED
jgi:3-methylcrotonyl-CoA carboxylase alpha subunit